jgi:hypothetical protein
MAHPLVVHCKRARFDVYIGRPSVWGNPFGGGAAMGGRSTRVGRDVALELYADWIRNQKALIERARRELRGKVLGCWCAPGRCHGDILAKLANERGKERETENAED